MPKRKTRRRRNRPPTATTFYDPGLGLVEVVWLAPGQTCPTCDHHEEHR